MTRTDMQVVDVYPYRTVENKVEVLLMRRTSSVAYAGTWRMLGGKIRDGETAWEAGLRELVIRIEDRRSV